MFWVILPALVFAILIPFSDKVSHKEVRRHAISKPFSWLWLLVLISLKILWVKFYSPNLGNQWTKAEQKRGGLELTNVRRAFCARVCVFRARLPEPVPSICPALGPRSPAPFVNQALVLFQGMRIRQGNFWSTASAPTIPYLEYVVLSWVAKRDFNKL